MPKRKLSNRLRWILNSSESGKITVDDGAIKALENKKSLLPSGVKSVSGRFEAGDVIMINETVKAVTQFNSTDLKAVAGKHSSEISQILGSGHKDVVATPENIVFMDY